MIMLRRLLFVASIAAALPVSAQTTADLTALKQEQARLRQSLDEIDRRIRVLEGTPAPAMTTVPAGEARQSTFVTLRQAWSEIKPGIMKARVNETLGNPAREMRINSDLVWYYVYPGIGNGSVFFNSEEKVTATQPPPI